MVIAPIVLPGLIWNIRVFGNQAFIRSGETVGSSFRLAFRAGGARPPKEQVRSFIELTREHFGVGSI